jgi:hypothetical protein
MERARPVGGQQAFVPPVQVSLFGPHFLKPLGCRVGRAILGFPINIGDHVREVSAHKQGLPERRLVWLRLSDDGPYIGLVGPHLWRRDRVGREFPHRAFAPVGDVPYRLDSLSVLTATQKLPGRQPFP